MNEIGVVIRGESCSFDASMSVPLLNLAEHNRPYQDRMREAFDRFLASGHYIGGDQVTLFEKEVASYLGVSECVAVSSGTDALLLALMALDVGPGDEVICPSFTFFATAGVVHRLGAKPVFAEILEGSFNMDPEDIEHRITPRTKGIIPVHLFGQMADIARIQAIADKHGLFVLEDAAQAIGARHNGKHAGSFGAFGAFSFYPTKNLSGLGDSGLVSTNDPKLAAKARILRVHGMDPVYYHSHVGGNFRFDPIQGALLRIKLPDLDASIGLRQERAARYVSRLGSHPSVALSCEEAAGKKLILPETSPGNAHTFNQFTIRVRGEGARDRLVAQLKAAGIGHGIYYPLGLHQQECFRCHTGGAVSLPITEAACREVLSIPIVPEIKLEQIDEVCDRIIGFLDGGSAA